MITPVNCTSIPVRVAVSSPRCARTSDARATACASATSAPAAPLSSTALSSMPATEAQPGYLPDRDPPRRRASPAGSGRDGTIASSHGFRSTRLTVGGADRGNTSQHLRSRCAAELPDRPHQNPGECRGAPMPVARSSLGPVRPHMPAWTLSLVFFRELEPHSQSVQLAEGNAAVVLEPTYDDSRVYVSLVSQRAHLSVGAGMSELVVETAG